MTSSSSIWISPVELDEEASVLIGEGWCVCEVGVRAVAGRILVSCPAFGLASAASVPQPVRLGANRSVWHGVNGANTGPEEASRGHCAPAAPAAAVEASRIRLIHTSSDVKTLH